MKCSVNIVKFICGLTFLFKVDLSLLVSCLDVVSIVNWDIKVPTIFELLSISPSRSVNIYFIYLVIPILSFRHYILCTHHVWIGLCIIM